MKINELSEIIDEEQYFWLVVEGVVEDEAMLKEINLDKYGDKEIKKLSYAGSDLMVIVFK